MKSVLCLLSLLIVSSVFGADAPSAPPRFTRTLYLVRHGEYDPKDQGPDGGSLTPLGVAQARLVAARLRGMPVNFSAIIFSTMTRAKQTASVIHDALPPTELESTTFLRECTPATWREDIMKNETPESVAAAETQLNRAFAEYFIPAKDADQHDILVCHGNVIRYLVTKALGVDTKAWLGFTFAHCSLTIIEVSSEGKFKVLSAGDIGHIPPNLQSGSTRKADPLVVAL